MKIKHIIIDSLVDLDLSQETKKWLQRNYMNEKKQEYYCPWTLCKNKAR